jgi:cytochrome c-type biogenesis protein
MAAFDPSLWGIFVFGLVAGICPCNSVLCLGLIGYLTCGEDKSPFFDTLKLTIPFSVGTVLALLPMGVIAGLIGRYLSLINETVAWGFGGFIMILMGLQLLKAWKPPIKSVFNFFKGHRSNTAKGTFLLGLSYGAITIGRGAPMLLIVLTYVALYQNVLEGFVSVFVYAVGLSIPLLVISSAGGAMGKKIKQVTSRGGELFDKAIGAVIVLIGIYFFYVAVT